MKPQDHTAMKEATETRRFRMGRNDSTGAWRLEDKERFNPACRTALMGLLGGPAHRMVDASLNREKIEAAKQAKARRLARKQRATQQVQEGTR